MKSRESWTSQMGFVFAAVGSAIGLANIWKFPYIVGKHGGAAFICVYLLCIMAIGFPTFVSEVIIGRKTKRNPAGAFKKLGKSKPWRSCGLLIVCTAFLITSFYSAIAGWILGYLMEALQGNLSSFTTASQTEAHFLNCLSTPAWTLGFHFLFMCLCTFIVLGGVRRGIEMANKVLMPILLLILVILLIYGLTRESAGEAIHFLLHPDWSSLTPAAIVIALGHSFFTLSIGQGTMITYGSYLNDSHNVPKSCIPIIFSDTLISLMASVTIFTIAFSAGIEPTVGEGLIFQTLPMVFSQIPGGTAIAILFFLLVVLAALTSEVSAMEPVIAYLVDEKHWSRKSAVTSCAIGAFLLGIPSALAFSVLKDYTLFNMNFLQLADFVGTNIMIPFGGLTCVLLVGWKWGLPGALAHLKTGAEKTFEKNPWIKGYFWFCIKYVAPILIACVFIHGLELF